MDFLKSGLGAYRIFDIFDVLLKRLFDKIQRRFADVSCGSLQAFKAFFRQLDCDWDGYAVLLLAKNQIIQHHIQFCCDPL